LLERGYSQAHSIEQRVTMPVYSMTGYASAQHSAATSGSEGDSKTNSTSRLGLEIRSVNSRFLDLSFKLPEELRQHEPALREQLVRQPLKAMRKAR
jgi:uncharacterized protein YicC (UPF0701 family)